MALNQINDRFIKTLTPPKDKNQSIYWDEKLTGFGVRITKNNAISFVLRYTIEGSERRYTIGSFPALSSTSAREMAIKLKGDIIKGIDPLSQKEEILKAPIFEELASKYISYAKAHIKPSTLKMYNILLKNYILPTFGKIKLAKITRKDVESLHISLKAKPHTANRTLELLSVMFNYAIKEDILKESPIFKIKKFAEERRERFLTDTEATKLLEYLGRVENKMNTRAVKLLILTGSRKSEVLKAEWKQFDFERGFWFKPASFTKQKKPSTIPLNKQALEILTEMKNEIAKEQAGDVITTKDYLFFNKKTNKPLGDIKRFWAGALKHTGLKDLRIHDLRHFFASTLVNSGVSLEITGKLIGHSNTLTTSGYSHFASDTLKNASELMAEKFTSLSKSPRT
jgi:integrase